MRPKRIVILGSSGSIGESALDVVRQFKGRFRVVGLAVGENIEKLKNQIREFHPSCVAVADEQGAKRLAAKTEKGTRVFFGAEGVCRLAALKDAELVLVAIVGSGAIAPLRSAIAAGKDIALANKEAVVMAGPLFLAEAKKNGVRIIPVDSEQNAIFQCLEGHDRAAVERVYLTASGGPLIDYTRRQLRDVAPEKVLVHPRWKMGRKITVDSATLMNKGLEVIETCELFGLRHDSIEVIIHRQAVIHSMVEFQDGSILAQMAATDMRLPIQYALTYPQRWRNGRLRLDPLKTGALTFAQPDLGRFPCLGLAYEAARRGGLMPCVLNAANEVAVAAYLGGKIAFGKIPSVIEKTMAAAKDRRADLTFDAVFDADARARAEAGRWVSFYGRR